MPHNHNHNRSKLLLLFHILRTSGSRRLRLKRISQNQKVWAGEMAQCVRMNSAKPDDPSGIPGTHAMKEESNFCKLSFDLLGHTVAHT